MSQRPQLDALFTPRSVVIIGASDRGNKPGARVAAMLSASSFNGILYGVNSREISVPRVIWHASLETLPEGIDVAILAVSAEASVTALEGLAAKGIRAAIVFSSGFGEAGPEGLALEDRLRAVARRHGIALCGPNTAGILNVHKGFVGIFTHALVSATPVPGPMTVISQSGAVAGTLLTQLAERQVGMSKWISAGNGAVLDVAHYLEWAADDPETGVLAVFLEGLTDGKRFLDAAQACRRAGKPIVVYKAGRSEGGARAAASHTGQLAGTDAVYDAAFRKAGIHRVDSIRAMADLCQTLAWSPPVTGRRGAVLSVSGAGCTMFADELDANGLALAEFGAETLERLAAVLPSFSQHENPVDISAHVFADLSRLTEVIAAVSEDPEVDFVALVFGSNNRVEIADTTVAAWTRKKPLALVLPASQAASKVMHDRFGAARVPVYREITDAARCLAALARDLPKLPAAQKPHVPPETDWLAGSQALALFAKEGLPVPGSWRVSSTEAAAARAADLGEPVVLKIDHPEIVHKTDIGGVRVGVAPADVEKIAGDIIAAAEATGVAFAPDGGLVVQQLVEPGTEVLVGLTRDATFGPVLTIGIGGVHVETIGEVTSLLPPADTAEIDAALDRTLLGKMLRHNRDGLRDIGALIKLIAAFQRVALARPEIIEAELNPVIVRADGHGCVVVDARARVAGEEEVEAIDSEVLEGRG